MHLCICMTVEESAKRIYNYLVFTAVFCTPQNCSRVESWNGWVGRDIEDHLVQSPWHGQGHVLVNYIA